MSTEFKNNYYEILEVPQTATHQDIVKAYEKAKKTYSADNPKLNSVFSTQEALELLLLVEEAFSVLSKNHLYKNDQNQKIEVIHNFENSSEIKIENLLKKEKEISLDLENEIATCSEWSGDYLRKIREYKKFSLNNLFEKTKVNPWYLKAIENMDPQNLPAPVYVRGYVVQLAKSLGLDEKKVADSYMKLFKLKLEKQK